MGHANMRNGKAKRKLDTQLQAEELAAKRTRLNPQEPLQRLADYVDSCRPKPPTAACIDGDAELASEAIPNQCHRQEPRVSAHGRHEPARNSCASQYMQSDMSDLQHVNG